MKMVVYFCITASWLFTYGYKSIQIQLHFRAMYTHSTLNHACIVSECLLQVMMGRTIMPDTPSVQWKNILVFTNNAKPLLVS